MITTYAVTFVSEPCGDDTWIKVIDLVSDWLVDNYPVEERPPGTFVRWRESSDDPVRRLAIDSSPPGSQYSSLLTVTMFRDGRRVAFDLRNVVRPMTHRITPGRGVGLPERLLYQLVGEVLQLLTVRDAERRVGVISQPIASHVDGQAVAALIDAPRRTLPVVVEVVDYERRTSPFLPTDIGPLAGLAHVFLLENKDALDGFVSISGETLIGPGSIATFWAGPRSSEVFSRRQIPDASVEIERRRLAGRIVDTAARALASLRVPPPPIVDEDDEPRSEPSVDAGDDKDNILAAYDETLRRVDELQSAVASADRIIAEQREELERKGGLIDDLVLRQVAMELGGVNDRRANDRLGDEVFRTIGEALVRAREIFTNLTFLPEAHETGGELEGPDPMAVFKDLWRLNRVARAWQAGEINDTSFHLACTREGLKYRPGVGEVAGQKYAEDYDITWRDRTVQATAHVGRGKGRHLYRIYFHLDPNTQDVVVARVVRHLRGKRDA